MEFWFDRFSFTAWSFDFLIVHLPHGLLTSTLPASCVWIRPQHIHVLYRILTSPPFFSCIELLLDRFSLSACTFGLIISHLLHGILISTLSTYYVKIWPQHHPLPAWSFDFNIIYLLRGVLTATSTSCVEFWPQHPPPAWTFDFSIIHLQHRPLSSISSMYGK